MGKIYNKDLSKGFSEYYGSDPQPEDGIQKGSEAAVFPIGVCTHKHGTERKVKGPFFRRRSVRTIYPVPSDTYESVIIPPNNNDLFVKESYEKFDALRRVNKTQPKGAHKFNLPPTVRLMEERDGSHSILVTNLNRPGFKVYDLKYFFKFSKYLSQNVRKFTADWIRKDLDLAETHSIALSDWANLNYPLDTWHLVIDEKTNTPSVYIVDVGARVKLNATKEQMLKTRKLVEEILPFLENGQPKV